jgi:glucosamine--fructose-6-phosphate aminotransferase (isomerizing)
MSENLIWAEILEEPAAIRSTVAEAREQARSITAALRARRIRRLYLIGNGTSYHTTLAGAALYRRRARPDDPILEALTAGEFRHYTPHLAAEDGVVGVSASGEFRDVVTVAEELAGRIPVIAVVHAPGSTLTTLAEHVLLARGGPSAVPVMTKTFASTLSATMLLVGEILGGSRADAIAAELLRAADDAERAIALAEPLVAPLAEKFAAAEHFFAVGSGGGHPAALEAALKLKEMAVVHAEGSESWEMASGAATLIGPTSTVVALAPAGRGREAVSDVARHSAEWGARVIEAGPERSVAGSDLLALPASASEDLASLTAVPPVALFAFALARVRGHDPDRPSWTERYRRQGLTHVVGAREES